MSNFTRPTLPTRGSSLVKRLLPAILLAPVAVVLSAWSFALPFQDGEEKVTIKGNGVPLLTVFKTIKKQAGYNFFYAANFVDDKEKVNLDVKNARVEDVLQKVLGSDYTWVYNENAVSITKKKEEVRRSSLLSIPDSSVTQITVSGAVTDAKGSPIPGATVMVKGTKDGASTDANGNFSLPGVAVNAVLVISSVGFEKREVQVKGKTILAKLNVSVNDLDEAVVVAYNTTTQRKSVGAISVVKGETIESLPNRSFDRSLQGQVPGLLVVSGNGQPGGGLSNFVLRGIGTGTAADFGSTVRNPLIIIDGTPVVQELLQMAIGANPAPVANPLAQINPTDIESITVLKDASAIALYGSRASNGVILITTKKGKTGKTSLTFRHQLDIASRVKGKTNVLSQSEYLELLYESYRNADPSRWSDNAIKADLQEKFATKNDGTFYPSPNWFEELYINRATTVSNNISISSGNDFTTSYLNLEYTTQNGIVKNTGYDRTSVRYNLINKVTSCLEVGVNSTFSYNRQNNSSFLDDGTDVTGLPYTMSPLNPVRLSNGEYQLLYNYGTPWSYSPVANPIASIEYNKNQINSYRGLGNIYAEFKILNNIAFKTNVGLDVMFSNSKLKIDPRLTDLSFSYSLGGSIQDRDLTRTLLNITNTLRYSRTINRHNVNLVLGQEAQRFNTKSLYVVASGFSSPFFDEVTSGNTKYVYGDSFKESLLSYLGQASYDYANKYFISLSGRRDGSSKFGDRERFGNYWSLGAGWIISEENFVRSNVPGLNYLKIRGSIGTSGNSAAINSTTRFDILNVVNYGGTFPGVRNSNSPGNPNIKWEETFNKDIGIEAKFIKDRINLSADFYTRDISQLIYTVNLPGSSGYLNVADNIGDMVNKGVEITVSSDVIKCSDFRWNLNFNWSTNKNKLLRANQPLFSSGNLINKEGMNFQSFYLVRWAGVNPVDGSPQWLDIEGKITSIYAQNNRVIVGKPQPDGFGGVTSSFHYRNLELTAFFYYQYGFKILDISRLSLINDGSGSSSPYVNQYSSALDRWQKPGDITSNPKRVLGNSSGSDLVSTRYLFDGDFIRLKNITLNYQIPKDLLEKMKLKSARLYIQANNIGLWTKFPGLDPENYGVSGGASFSYPQQKSFSVGININF